MTTFTPIRRHRPLFETQCTGRCNQGRACTCADLADKGTTLAANDAIERDKETRGDGAGVMLVPAAVALFAVVCGALAAAFFN